MTAGPAGRVAPPLAGHGLALGPWEERDLPGVVELADPASRTWSPSFRTLRTLDDARRWVAARTGDPDRVDWAVRDPGSGTLLGRVSLHRFVEHPAAAEVGYGVHPAHRGRGVATRAVEVAATYGFRSLGLHRVTLFHAVGNTASCRVAMRSGFDYEGIEREAMDHGDGVLHDMHRHARLRTDPPGRAAPAPAAVEVPVVEADGLRLRPWTQADAPAYLRGLTDPAAARWYPLAAPETVDDARRLLAGLHRRSREGSTVAWAVESDGALVGSVALRSINRVDRWATASYWVLPEARGRGIAGRALGLATAYAFAGLDLHRVQLQHAVANTASCRVADRAGFALEATLSESCLLAEGFVDEHQHAKVRDR